MLCPDCIIPMTEETRTTKLGNRIFLVCPNCGYNEQRCCQGYYKNEEIAIRDIMKKRDQQESEINNN